MAVEPVMFPDVGGVEFVRSSEVKELADDVLDRHGRSGGVPRLHPVAQAILREEISVLWLLNCKPFDPDKDEEGHDVAGKCLKVPGLWRDITGYDVAIWIREYFWREWPADTRRAALLHELLHVEVTHNKDDEVKVAVRKHDVEDFVDVVRHYGPLFGDGPALVRAAALYAGEPEPLDPKGRRPKAGS